MAKPKKKTTQHAAPPEPEAPRDVRYVLRVSGPADAARNFVEVA